MAADQSLSTSISEILATARGHFVWPDDVTLYCLPKSRELLPDKVCRLCFQAYLQLSELHFDTITAPNADAMSPNGQAPFVTVRIGPHLTIFSDFEKLVLFLNAQSLGLDSSCEAVVKADNEAFSSLVTTQMAPAEVYQTWICYKNYIEHTVKYHGSEMAWPLNKIIPQFHRIEMFWKDWTLLSNKKEGVLMDFKSACNALHHRLGHKETFSEERLSCLDVLVFSHLRAILTTPLPSNELDDIVRQYPNLVSFADSMADRYNL